MIKIQKRKENTILIKKMKSEKQERKKINKDQNQKYRKKNNGRTIRHAKKK